MVHVKELSLQRGKRQILNNISLTLPQGKVTAFIGGSGAGKTSLIRCLAHLYTDYTGEILIEGRELRTLLRKERSTFMALVFQQWHLFPHMTVEENCIHPQRTVLKREKREAQERARQLFQQLNIEAVKTLYPCQISGGQQQRVAIARALCLQPKLLLFDEPSSALDPQTTRDLAQLIRNFVKRGMTVAFSSHDPPFIGELSDQLYLLKEGSLIKEATRETWSRSPLISSFLSPL